MTTGQFEDDSCGSFLSPLWTDIKYTGPGDGIFITENDDEVVVRWDGVVTEESKMSEFVGGGVAQNWFWNQESRGTYWFPLYMDFPFYGEIHSEVSVYNGGAIFFDDYCLALGSEGSY